MLIRNNIACLNFMFLCILISMYILYMHVFCLYIEEVLILLNMIDHCQRNVTLYLIARSLFTWIKIFIFACKITDARIDGVEETNNVPHGHNIFNGLLQGDI